MILRTTNNTMPRTYTFAFAVTLQHPYTDPPDCKPSDHHYDSYMALIRCAAGKPSLLLNLKDDERVLYKDTNCRGNTFLIELAGEGTPVSIPLGELVKTPGGRAYVESVLRKATL